jgi:CBS-domain-containing membrane protein
MTRGVKTVREDQSVDSVYELMSREQVRRVPVVDQNDEIIGIIAVKDLAEEDESKHDLAQTVEQISEGPGNNQARR